jgi:hypothetical protein
VEKGKYPTGNVTQTVKAIRRENRFINKNCGQTISIPPTAYLSMLFL